MQFEDPNAFHLHELSGPRARTTTSFRLPIEMDERMRDYAKARKLAKGDLSLVYRHAVYEYLMARGIDCLKPIGCL